MTLIQTFVYIGTIAFGVSGALLGIRKQLDIFGVLFLCFTTSLGGGVIRDIMIGNIPPQNLIDPQYFLVSLAAGIITLLFYDKIAQLNHSMLFFDAIGLGVFTAVGAQAALNLDFNQPFLVVAMGLVTGIGGGVMRDVFAKEIPFVFRKEIYGIASIAGSISLILTYNVIPTVLSLYLCLLITFIVRVLSVKFQLNVPVVRKSIGNSEQKLES
ncbi:trimeric intracellular cation channel family protein [Aquibacillus saliphilus]|uniref:trimeric intracellular cation channel family protein n=1 Tax=Aquibacillus saliphilus TaxID=1909422 RepID=UPI001CEFBA9F|nr:trimeric intracellular cation channel family protein [Aquibacillus saliphilus]